MRCSGESRQYHPGSRVVSSLAVFLATASFVTGSIAATYGVRNPGRVLVDTVSRQAYLKSLGPAVKEVCPVKVSGDIPPIRSIEGSHGPDVNAIQLTARIMDYGGACLAGLTDACQKTVNIMDSWSSTDALSVVITTHRGPPFWDVTLTANLALKPMIVSYAIARTVITVDAETDNRIIRWLTNRVQTADNTDENPRNSAQNHFIMSKSTQMAMGSLNGDATLFTKGIERWRVALADMRSDGSFPLETRRGSRALWYTMLQLNSLISIGEMAALQGYNIYAERSPTGKTIHDAVSYAIDALEDQNRIRVYAREQVAAPSSSPDEQDLSAFEGLMAWVEPYTSRFPSHPNTARLAKLELDISTCSLPRIAPRGCTRTNSRKLADILSRPLRSNWFGGVTSCMQGRVPFLGVAK